MFKHSMKNRLVFALVVASLLFSPILTAMAAPLVSEVWVDDDFDSSTDGYGYTHFDSIQQAVDVVAASGTVHVAPGTYEVFQVFKPGLSLLAESGAIVDGNWIPSDLSTNGVAGGITVGAENVTIQGFTVQDCHTGIYVTGSLAPVGEPIEPLFEPDPETPFNALIQGNTINNCGYGIEAYGVGNTFKENTVTNIDWTGMYIYGIDTIIEDNHVNQAGEFGILFGGETATISENTATNTTVGLFGDGIMNSEVYNNTSHNNEAGLVLLGVGNQVYDNVFCDNDVLGIESISDNDYRVGEIEPVPVYTPNEYTGNIITGNGGESIPDATTQTSTRLSPLVIESGGIYCTTNNIFRGNHIADNIGYGLYVETASFRSKTDVPIIDNVDAILNWWGHTSGPFHPLSNPDASGQMVSDYVDYSPWLLAEPNAPAPVATLTDALMEGESIGIDGVVNAVVSSGEGTVTVGEYAENPTDTSLFGSVGSYADVYLTSPNDIEELVIYLYYEGTPENEEDLVLHWWNGSEWIACSDSGVDIENKYVWAVISSDSIPALTDLSGTEIGAGLVEPEGEDDPEDKEDLPDTGGLGISLYGFVVMAAGYYVSRKRED